MTWTPPPDRPGTAYEAATARDDAAFNASFGTGWRTELAGALGAARAGG